MATKDTTSKAIVMIEAYKPESDTEVQRFDCWLGDIAIQLTAIGDSSDTFFNSGIDYEINEGGVDYFIYDCQDEILALLPAEMKPGQTVRVLTLWQYKLHWYPDTPDGPGYYDSEIDMLGIVNLDLIPVRAARITT